MVLTTILLFFCQLIFFFDGFISWASVGLRPPRLPRLPPRREVLTKLFPLPLPGPPMSKNATVSQLNGYCWPGFSYLKTYYEYLSFTFLKNELTRIQFHRSLCRHVNIQVMETNFKFESRHLVMVHTKQNVNQNHKCITNDKGKKFITYQCWYSWWHEEDRKDKCTVSCDGLLGRRLKLTNCGTQHKMLIKMYKL